MALVVGGYLIADRVTDISSISEEIADKILPPGPPDQVFQAQVSSDKIGIGDFLSSVPKPKPSEEKEVIKIDSKDVDRIIKLLVELKYGDNIIEEITRSSDVEAKTVQDRGLDKIKQDVEEFVNR